MQKRVVFHAGIPLLVYFKVGGLAVLVHFGVVALVVA